MEEVKDFKNSDFGYGNEIPQFLDFLDKKKPYWEILYQKLLNKQ